MKVCAKAKVRGRESFKDDSEVSCFGSEGEKRKSGLLEKINTGRKICQLEKENKRYKILIQKQKMEIMRLKGILKKQLLSGRVLQISEVV